MKNKLRRVKKCNAFNTLTASVLNSLSFVQINSKITHTHPCKRNRTNVLKIQGRANKMSRNIILSTILRKETVSGQKNCIYIV